MGNYINLSDELVNRINSDREKGWKNPYAFKDEDVIRKYPDHDKATIWRPAFVRDVEKIMHNPYYNRYSDKTQVFSLFKNDDITRRAKHVQLVSRIARNIGAVLGLNLDLIEAISLGHDIGHTPFGHAGERKLSELYSAHTGRSFNHNIQSARVFTTIYPVNLSLQTLDGIICHNGELELKEYRPVKYREFETFEKRMEETYVDSSAIEKLVPTTLEGCVMRISDIIAYLGKDRQDAEKIGLIDSNTPFATDAIGRTNSEIINNMIVNIIERSYGKDYLSMDPEFFEALKKAKKENYELIYKKDEVNRIFDDEIYPMIEAVYEKLREDLINHNEQSVIYTHHLNYINSYRCHYPGRNDYDKEGVDEKVVDYIASMTDDYFIDLYHHLFKDGKYRVEYKGYFVEE